MKASEMTNEELAKFLDQAAPYFEDRFLPEFNEIAARLRKLTACEKAIKVAVETGESFSNDCAKLKRRLKVAEDALEKITTGSFPHRVVDKPIVQIIIDIARDALFAIREEGGAK